MGNPDYGQYLAVSDPQVIVASTLQELREKALTYIQYWNLGGGNWPNCVVKLNNKKIGYMSYNGRFWDNNSKEII